MPTETLPPTTNQGQKSIWPRTAAAALVLPVRLKTKQKTPLVNATRNLIQRRAARRGRYLKHNNCLRGTGIPFQFRPTTQSNLFHCQFIVLQCCGKGRAARELKYDPLQNYDDSGADRQTEQKSHLFLLTPALSIIIKFCRRRSWRGRRNNAPLPFDCSDDPHLIVGTSLAILLRWLSELVRGEQIHQCYSTSSWTALLQLTAPRNFQSLTYVPATNFAKFIQSIWATIRG